MRELYQMKEIEEPGDILTFYVFSKEDGAAVDSFSISRQGNKYYVRGYWKGYKDAQEWANQVLDRWL